MALLSGLLRHRTIPALPCVPATPLPLVLRWRVQASAPVIMPQQYAPMLLEGISLLLCALPTLVRGIMPLPPEVAPLVVVTVAHARADIS